MDAWAYGAGVKLHFIRPGKPVENAYVESFNGHFRDECLNMHWFTSVQDAACIIRTLGEVAKAGVEILAYRARLSEREITLGERVEVGV